MANGHELAMRLRIAYLALHRRTNAELARFGMTADQFVLLTILSEGDAVTQKDLVERSGSDPNTMSERLVRLERLGLISRERHATDGRARSVALTEKGRGVQRCLWESSDPLRQMLEGLFPRRTLDTLVDQLNRVASAMATTGDEKTRESHRGRPLSARRRQSTGESEGR